MSKVPRSRSDLLEPTIGSVLDRLLPIEGGPSSPPLWPPDAFAVAATLLRDSGAYIGVAGPDWPPQVGIGSLEPASVEAWASTVRRAGLAWRRSFDEGVRVPGPDGRFGERWRAILDARDLPLSRIATSRELCFACLEVLAIADEASRGAGMPPMPEDETSGSGGDAVRPFVVGAFSRLMRNDFRSLCERVPIAQAAVLPKMHTPSVGLTLRSLSHHLALVPRSPVSASWHWIRPSQPVRRRLNLLLLPWPERVDVERFHAIRAGDSSRLPRDEGFFDAELAASTASVVPRVRRALRAAAPLVDGIDAIVFPEAAIRRGGVERISAAVHVPVVGGEAERGRGGRLGTNAAVIAVPVGAGFRRSHRQPKHHRWTLDRRQLEAYGIAGRLAPSQRWWEGIEIEPRSLQFAMFDSRLALCVLTCEDLARQDPVADVVRAIGPNLVVALLADGPQLRERWSARYASVLADDPGSSVLSLTSLGMALRSVPEGHQPRRVVGLWRDPTGPSRELTLPEGAEGLVLALANEVREERTADGRTDRGETGMLTFAGCYPVGSPARARPRRRFRVR